MAEIEMFIFLIFLIFLIFVNFFIFVFLVLPATARVKAKTKKDRRNCSHKEHVGLFIHKKKRNKNIRVLAQ